MQVAEPLKNMATRYEELRKSHAEFAAKLERERDAAYSTYMQSLYICLRLIAMAAALKRAKGQYDGSCQEVESRRKKIESSFDMRYLTMICKSCSLTDNSKASRRRKTPTSNRYWICIMLR